MKRQSKKVWVGYKGEINPIASVWKKKIGTEQMKFNILQSCSYKFCMIWRYQ